MQNVDVKLNPGFSRQKWHFVRRRIFLSANCTWI